MHKKGLSHNDIKPENIMSTMSFDKRDVQGTKIALIDYGLMSNIGEKQTGGTQAFLHPAYLINKGLPNLPQKDVYAISLSFLIIDAYHNPHTYSGYGARDLSVFFPKNFLIGGNLK